jgi:small subunit ribosomal protein S16
MMRLQRVGRKNDPAYRLVVTDKRTSVKSDRHIDRIGSYNPKFNQVQLDVDKVKHWLAQGVQPSDTVYNLLVGEKIIAGRKKNVLSKKSPIIDEAALKRAAEEAEAKAKAEAAAAAAAEASAATETETPVTA